MTDAIVVEDPNLVDAMRGLRQVNDADALRILGAIRGLKAGTITAEQLQASVQAGTFRSFIDAIDGRQASQGRAR